LATPQQGSESETPLPEPRLISKACPARQ